MPEAQDFQARLQALRDSYSEQLPARVDEIRTLWEKLRATPDPEDLRLLHRLVHSLTGSGATFGHTELSAAARVMELCLKEIQDHNYALDTARCGRVNAYLLAVETVALTERVKAQKPDDASEPPVLASETENRLIFLVEDDPRQAQELSLQMQNFGYVVTVFADTKALKAALQVQQPAVIVVDIAWTGGDTQDSASIKEITTAAFGQVPIIFVSSRDDLPARLAAVRAGGDGYFIKPVDVSAIIDMLDHLTARRVAEAYRIVIVDDDKTLADHYALTLRHAAMEVATINEPLEVMALLLDFKPDLILMDIYMPQCNGLDLAAVLRQQADHDSIPIVFLSTDIDADLRMRAMRLGADDFLHKPILPKELVSAVSSRVQRARVLRAYMIHDSLTGLFNHSTTKEHLQREFSRARRQGRPLAYAMLDLDHFKSINDRFGHAAGDRVLKSLARMLQQRLRTSDIIGRVGGEEFAVVFTDTDAAAALQVIDIIRRGFAQIRHYCEAEQFNVTFSCGIVAMDQTGDFATLYNAADRALYQAKRAGRNRVVVAQD